MKDPLKWTTTEGGEKHPEYTDEQAHRIARAAFEVMHLLPHPDQLVAFADAALNHKNRMWLIEFNRALIGAPPLCERCGCRPCSDETHGPSSLLK